MNILFDRIDRKMKIVLWMSVAQLVLSAVLLTLVAQSFDRVEHLHDQFTELSHRVAQPGR